MLQKTAFLPRILSDFIPQKQPFWENTMDGPIILTTDGKNMCFLSNLTSKRTFEKVLETLVKEFSLPLDVQLSANVHLCRDFF